MNNQLKTVKFILILIITLNLIYFVNAEANSDTEVRLNHNQLDLNQNSLIHGFLERTSNQQINQVAEAEEWEGDGSESNPYVMTGYTFNQV